MYEDVKDVHLLAESIEIYLVRYQINRNRCTKYMLILFWVSMQKIIEWLNKMPNYSTLITHLHTHKYRQIIHKITVAMKWANWFLLCMNWYIYMGVQSIELLKLRTFPGQITVALWFVRGLSRNSAKNGFQSDLICSMCYLTLFKLRWMIVDVWKCHVAQTVPVKLLPIAIVVLFHIHRKRFRWFSWKIIDQSYDWGT